MAVQISSALEDTSPSLAGFDSKILSSPRKSATPALRESVETMNSSDGREFEERIPNHGEKSQSETIGASQILRDDSDSCSFSRFCGSGSGILDREEGARFQAASAVADPAAAVEASDDEEESCPSVASTVSNYNQSAGVHNVRDPLPSSVCSPSSEDDVSITGAGLENLGNTCFLNAVLQCFTHTAPLVLSLRSFNHVSPCPDNQGGFCMVCALRNHIDYSLASSGGIIRPDNLVQNLSHVSSSFQKYQQEDAHEFLQCMLDRLHTCSLKSQKYKQEQASSSSEEDSFIKQIFGGRLRSQVRCCNCDHCSDTYEPLNDLSLEVEDADNLLDALKLFTQVEKIGDPDMMFTCESCKMKVSVEKQLILDRIPEVLTFHFKRFKNYGCYVEKINKFVGFPLKLDMRPFIGRPDANNEELKYELYAVVVHEGLYSGCGHYISFIHSSEYAWHRVDDEKVSRVSEKLVLSQNAYILFYARRGSPRFSSLMEMQKRKSLDSVVVMSTSPKLVLNENEERTEPISIADSDNKISVREANGDLSEKLLNSSGISNLVKAINKADEGLDGWDISPPSTPPRSPSPEIVTRVPSGTSGLTLHPQDRHDSRQDTGKVGAKSLTDLQTKALNRQLRGMPASRRQSLMQCIPSLCHQNKRRRMFATTAVPSLRFSPRSSTG